VLIAVAAATVGLAGVSATVAQTTSSSGPPPPTATTGLTERGERTSGPPAGPAAGGRIENLAVGLRLQSARLERVDLHDSDREYAVYHVSGFVHDIKDVTGFRLVGFDPDSHVSADDARLVHGDPTSVLVGFAPGTDLVRYSLATATMRTVEDEAGRGNLPASVALGGSTLGSAPGRITDNPRLIGAQPVPTLDRVVYTYGEQLDPNSAGDPSRFGYYTLDGKRVAATAIVTLVDNTVTAQFDRQSEDGVLFYDTGGAVKDRAGKESPLGAVGSATTAPHLISVSGPVGRTQFDLTFDQPVTEVAPAKIMFYAVDGTRDAPTGFVRPAATVVRVSLPEVQKFASTLVLAAIDDGAVKAEDGSNTASTIGTWRIGTSSPEAGFTAAPDLVGVAFETTTGQVRYRFDQAVDDDRLYDPRLFFVVTPAGDLVAGRAFVETAGNDVLVTFDKNVVAAAVGAVVDEGAVQDFQGKRNATQLLMGSTTSAGPAVTAGGPATSPTGDGSDRAPPSTPAVEDRRTSSRSTTRAGRPTRRQASRKPVGGRGRQGPGAPSPATEAGQPPPADRSQPPGSSGSAGAPPSSPPQNPPHRQEDPPRDGHRSDPIIGRPLPLIPLALRTLS
jgi:hypothetical protein